VSLEAAPADATPVLDIPTLLAVASGRLSLAQAVESGRVRMSGDRRALKDFGRLFENGPGPQ
jgi:hypothetical protein